MNVWKPVRKSTKIIFVPKSVSPMEFRQIKSLISLGKNWWNRYKRMIWFPKFVSRRSTNYWLNTINLINNVENVDSFVLYHFWPTWNRRRSQLNSYYARRWALLVNRLIFPVQFLLSSRLPARVELELWWPPTMCWNELHLSFGTQFEPRPQRQQFFR